MKQEWRVYTKRADFNAIGNKFGFDPVIARIIRNRDIIEEDEIEDYVYPSLDKMLNPHGFKDIDLAAEIIDRHIENGSKIRIIGDYDIDGINSIYILYTGLENIGANVDFVVPHRIIDGYGINEKLIDNAKEDGVSLIITCDNGIAAYNQTVYAKELGMDIIITDHHEVPFEMIDGEKKYIVPPADAVVDAKQEDCSYEFKAVCGAVVAYKLIQVMYERHNEPADRIYEFLEFAAMATVGDVVDLIGENRIIVKNGLTRIKNTSNIGLNALIDVNCIKRDRLSSFHLGFVIGPCLNASGRLDTAKDAIDLFRCKDKTDAERRAGELKSLNEERKTMTMEGLNAAVNQIESSDMINDMVLVVYLPECHESIVGIIAGKIREKYNKPVIVFANGEGCLKGSGRSTEFYNMFEKISEVKELLDKFGGHPMAAGMSIQPDKLGQFRKLLNEKCGITEEDLVLKHWIDVPMPFGYISFPLISQLEILEPFGKSNEKPVFGESKLKIKQLTHMGKEKNFTKVIFEKEDGFLMEGVLFAIDEILENAYKNGEYVSVLYYPDVNEYMGKSKIQATIKAVKIYEQH